MLPITQYITKTNRTISNRAKIDYLVMHYVGAVSTAKNNGDYFYSTYRGASAHYFVDDTSIYQVVKDKDISWHCGADKYYCNARNSNSIGIEMCCIKKNGKIDISELTVANALELAAYICKKYNIPVERVVRHYDVSHKKCPAPFVDDESRWVDFKNKLASLLNGGSTPVTPVNPEVDTMNKTMYVNATAGLNVRKGAGTGYKIVETLKNLTKVTVKEMSNDWARIGHERWVCATYLTEESPSVVVTTTTKYVNVGNSTLNIRSGAGTNYRIVGSLNNGAKVSVYEEKNGWAKIGDGQWVSSQYLTTTPQATTKTMYVSPNEGLNVRSGAGTGYGVVKALTKGTKVTVYEEKNGWSKIGSDQWVSSKYLTTQLATTVTKYVVPSVGVNVRKGAGTQYKIVKALPKGAKVTVYEDNGSWSRIGNNEWVSSAYIK